MKNRNGIEGAIKQWSENPIGISYSSFPIGSEMWFEEIAQHRYETYAPWMRRIFQFEKFKGKKVLEIGVGVGTDHVSLARAGAILSGIDITSRSIELTSKNLHFHNFFSDLHVANTESLPFPDNNFDVVFSFGVLHHISNIEKAISEIERVLKPRGEILIGLYNRKSLYYWYKIMKFPWSSKDTILKRFQAIEIGQKESQADIIVNAYSRSEIKKLFQQFTSQRIFIKHPAYCFANLRIVLNKKIKNKILKNFILFSLILFKCITDKIDTIIGDYFGWYLIIRGKK